MSALPTRAEWDDACRGAAGEPGSWQRVAGPFWVLRPVRATKMPVTVHGHSGDVNVDIDDVLLRFSPTLVERINGLGIDDVLDAYETIFGQEIRVVDRGGLHARSPHDWVHEWATDWDDPSLEPDEHPDPVPGMLLPGWKATRWDGRLLLIVWGGPRGERVAAPAGVMALDWKPWRPHAATVQPLPLWDRVTAALLEAATSGADPIDAARAAITGPDRGAPTADASRVESRWRTLTREQRIAVLALVADRPPAEHGRVEITDADIDQVLGGR